LTNIPSRRYSNDMSTERRNTRTRLIEAAERVVAGDGVARLTLDAVARKADVSKGGLLYHFPNKDALISAMVLRWVDGFERDIGQRLEVEEAGALGSWARAYAGATFEPGETQETQSRELVALLAAIATDPALLEPLRRRFEAWQARAEDDGLDLALATLLRLAADGLWFADLFGLAPPAGELRGQVLREINALARGEEGA
jgi:AcrR family transcriptional regulator